MSVPIYNLTDTWNDGGTAFTAIKMNVADTASGAASKLLDLQVGGISKFSVGKTGALTGSSFSASASGLVPASGGGTTNFLRADGSWTTGGGISGDPLTLNLGLNLAVANPSVGASTFVSALQMNMNDVTAANVDPGFSNVQGIGSQIDYYDGDNNYNALTHAKTSMLPINFTLNYYGAGQRFFQATRINAYGMGDAFFQSRFLEYGAGPIAGDEGVGYSAFSEVTQLEAHHRAHIVSATRTTLSTTATNAITGSKSPQVVVVGSVVGAVIGDWVVVEQSVDTGQNNIEAVKITAVGAGTITGIFRLNHNAGVTITPALVLGVDTLTGVGQQRVVVNLDGTTYTTGTIVSNTGSTLNGSGTAFANNMVGGSALNVGAISLLKDDFFITPGDPIKSWYQIQFVSSGTAIGVHSYSVAGDEGYRGAGSYPTTFTIRPAARILKIEHASSRIILETSAHTWSVGNLIQWVLCPFPDVSGEQIQVGGITPGGTYRNAFTIKNLQYRKFERALLIDAIGNAVSAGGDPWAWGTGIQVARAQNSITLIGPADVGITFADVGAPFSSGIRWASIAQSLTANGLGGMDLGPLIRTKVVAGFNSILVSDIGNTNFSSEGTLDIQLAGTANKGLVIRHGFGQTANIFECQGPGGPPGAINMAVEVSGSVRATSIRGIANTFAQCLTLIFSTPIEGMLISVTDSTTAVWGAVITGGGANHVLGYYNGTNWTVAGK